MSDLKYGLIPWLELRWASGKNASGPTLKAVPLQAVPDGWLIKDVVVTHHVAQASKAEFTVIPLPRGGAGGAAARATVGAIADHDAVVYGSIWTIAMGYLDPGLNEYTYEVFRGIVTDKQPSFKAGVNSMRVTLHSAAWYLQYFNLVKVVPNGTLADAFNQWWNDNTELHKIFDLEIAPPPPWGDDVATTETPPTPSEGAGQAKAAKASKGDPSAVAGTNEVAGTTGQNIWSGLNDYAAQNGFVVADMGTMIRVGPPASIYQRKKGTLHHPNDALPEDEFAFESLEPTSTAWRYYGDVKVIWVPPHGADDRQPIIGQVKVNTDKAREMGLAVPNSELVVSNVPVSSVAEAEALARSICTGAIIYDMEAKLTCPGTWLMLGDIVTLKGNELGPYAGEWFVEGATHTWDDSGYHFGGDLLKVKILEQAHKIKATSAVNTSDFLYIDPNKVRTLPDGTQVAGNAVNPNNPVGAVGVVPNPHLPVYGAAEDAARTQGSAVLTPKPAAKTQVKGPVTRLHAPSIPNTATGAVVAKMRGYVYDKKTNRFYAPGEVPK